MSCNATLKGDGVFSLPISIINNNNTRSIYWSLVRLVNFDLTDLHFEAMDMFTVFYFTILDIAQSVGAYKVMF